MLIELSKTQKSPEQKVGYPEPNWSRNINCLAQVDGCGSWHFSHANHHTPYSSIYSKTESKTDSIVWENCGRNCSCNCKTIAIVCCTLHQICATHIIIPPKRHWQGQPAPRWWSASGPSRSPCACECPKQPLQFVLPDAQVFEVFGKRATEFRCGKLQSAGN